MYSIRLKRMFIRQFERALIFLFDRFPFYIYDGLPLYTRPGHRYFSEAALASRFCVHSPIRAELVFGLRLGIKIYDEFAGHRRIR